MNSDLYLFKFDHYEEYQTIQTKNIKNEEFIQCVRFRTGSYYSADIHLIYSDVRADRSYSSYSGTMTRPTLPFTDIMHSNNIQSIVSLKERFMSKKSRIRNSGSAPCFVRRYKLVDYISSLFFTIN